ncbi:hypothetical protein AO366_0060 [Moraxella catarrhalis]|uniref:Uncharacterized protein n=1 Tax=Moraxella catarrhalis TaxID=480 RepID=A0A198ULE1_MORCA|nr:hypothetical protein AO384_0680 [Moraxella catarrhalis]OAU98549.1 hypothetical protein AO383_0615 [Moraxella catarrhalis]OAV09065.1 hypothetical protein AO377_1408 [Moraxella catarrhalis]OAV34634.1 hypothetical protein AO366_0060 [Moraxella catarrhalis]
MTHQSSKQACKILGIKFWFLFWYGSILIYPNKKTVQSVCIERFL